MVFPDKLKKFGVYTFAFHTNVPSPVVAYRNRWGTWTSMWFYHKVPLNGATRTHPLVVKVFGPLWEKPPSVEVDEGTEEAKAHVAMLREVSKLFRHEILWKSMLLASVFPFAKGGP